MTDLATGLGALPIIVVRDLSPRWQGRADGLLWGTFMSAWASTQITPISYFGS